MTTSAASEAVSPADQLIADRQSLERLVVDNPDLEKLESLLKQFNIFEAIGAVRQELRHSDFLAFLLDPQQSHGLKDVFAKRLLQAALINADSPNLPITPVDLDVWSLEQTVVQREWQHIDILLVDASNKFVIIFENKIDTGERDQQLQCYWQIVKDHYPDSTIIGLYVTPAGDPPSDGKYIALSYSLVRQTVKSLAKQQRSALAADVHTLMIHYAQMLRRHIVSDSDIAKLCRKIYAKHKSALDLIYEHRPDQQATISEILGQLIKETPSLVLEVASKTQVLFGVEEWDVPSLLTGQGWAASGRLLLFRFVNEPNQLRLSLVIGPGPELTRRRIFDALVAHAPMLKPSGKTLRAKWNSLYGHTFLTPDDYEDSTVEEMEQKIKQQWSNFLTIDLPAIKAALDVDNLLQGSLVTPQS